MSFSSFRKQLASIAAGSLVYILKILSSCFVPTISKTTVCAEFETPPVLLKLETHLKPVLLKLSRPLVVELYWADVQHPFDGYGIQFIRAVLSVLISKTVRHPETKTLAFINFRVNSSFSGCPSAVP